jgi:peptide/nickel transport system substrate-binding protein
MNGTKVHSHIPEMLEQVKTGTLSRREFLRRSTLLGLSAGIACQLVGFSGVVRNARAAEIRRGGVLMISCSVMKVTHPAQYSWIQPANIFRQVLEYLTITGPDNITRPYLCESWKVSEDLQTWTFNLRKGVRFNNSDAFTADDVMFTIGQWLDKDVQSSMLGLIGDYLDMSGLEKVSDHQIKLHLKRPEIAVPEHLFHFPAQILNHKTFQGDILKAPHGTGPYTLEVYSEGQAAELKARSDYWQLGADGKALPYLDGIKFIDMGTERAPQIAALQSQDIHLIETSDNPGPDIMLAVQNDPNIQVLSVSTAQTRVLRMRSDVHPWTDNRVRTALKLCQNREKILALAFHGQGLQAHDTHVYPNHPEYCRKSIPGYDPQKAKALLKEAGYPEGITVNLAVASAWTDVVRYAEILEQDAKPAGIKININTMPTSQYWEKWTEVALGITPWTHRPLGTMVLNLGYAADAEGKALPWNETRWVDEEFNTLLKQANGTLDVEERRKIFCKLEQIQMDRGSIGLSFWMNTWICPNKRLNNVQAHPTAYLLLNEAWLES